MLDENTAEDFVSLLPSHDVATVRSAGWLGMKNGALLDSTEGAGFDAFMTVDKQMRYQQNLGERRIALIVLDVHPTSAENQIACLPQIDELLRTIQPGQVHVIEGPHPKRSGT